jgi:polysaccharide biosynthesis/export protein
MFKRLRSYRVQRPLARLSAVLFALSSFAPALAEEKKPADPKPAEKKAPAKPAKSEKPEQPSAQYKLGPGDELAVTVSPQTGYDCAGIVLPDGLLYLKNVGEVRAGGMTVPELRIHIRKVLEDEPGLLDPEVAVLITRLRPPDAVPAPKIGKITVVGAVLRAGPIDLEEGLRARKALDLAGGTTKDADLGKVKIIHTDQSVNEVDLSRVERLSDPAQNRILRDGDSIEVPALPVIERVPGYVRIEGQVLVPGRYLLKPEIATLTDLIVVAGKLTLLADLGRIEYRKAGGQKQSIDLFKQQDLGLDGQIPLEPGDEVFIHKYKDTVVLVGAIPNAGLHPVKPGQKLQDFITQPSVVAAANPAQSNLEDVRLMRGQETIKVDLRDILGGKGKGRGRGKGKTESKDDIVLQSGDVLYFPEKKEPGVPGITKFTQFLGPLGYLIGGVF